MLQERTVTDQVMEAVAHHPGCLMEEVILACPELTWNQIFLEVDRLSRSGRVHVTLEGTGVYRVRPAKL